MSRIVLAGTFDPNFARNRRIRALLEHLGHDIETCQVDVWAGDRYLIPQQSKLATLVRAARAYPRLVWRFLRLPRADVVVVLYPGWFDLPLLSFLARLRRMPVVFDIFISLYDTVVSDRKLASPRSWLGRLCLGIDRCSLRRATHVLADTPAHAEFFASLADLPPDRFSVVWLGAQDEVFRPQAGIEPQSRRVLFHGTFIALQGLETIVHAAKLLEDDDVEFRIVGSGQEQGRVEALVDDLQITNMELVGLIPLEEVPREIAAATVCLGIFGTTGKAHRVVPNKLYECVAVGRPVITGDTPAVRSAFSEEEIALTLPGDPTRLAGAIRRWLDDPVGREAAGAAAHRRYLTDYATGPLSARLDEVLKKVR